MGNYSCCSEEPAKFSIGSIGTEIIKSIERNDLKALRKILSNLSEFELTIDSPIINIKNISLNPLSYSVFTGKKNAFSYIYHKGASVDEMNRCLSLLDLTAIEIICEQGYTELLEFYLPIYLKENRSTSNFSDSLDPTLNF